MSNADNSGWDISKGDYEKSTRIPNAVVGKKRPLTPLRLLLALISVVFIAVSAYIFLLWLEFI